MDQSTLRDWEKAVDKSEETPITADLPKEYPIGGDYYEEQKDGPHRHWKYLQVVSGKVGGRWCYWKSWVLPRDQHHKLGDVLGVGPNPEHQIIVDSLFNGDAHHFVGMIGIPFNGIKGPAWVLISPRMYPPPEQKVFEEKQNERYERSREIYSVDTHKATPLDRRETD